AHEVAPLLPRVACRPHARHRPGSALRRPRFLTTPTPNMMRTLETETQPPPRTAIKAVLSERARALGFETVRITRPDAIPEAGDRLAAFLADGRHGTMEWMATNADRRRDPRRLWPGARSVVMLAMSYAPETD